MSKVYVTATDKFMSGWGMAEGKISKLVIVCDNWEDARKVYNNYKENRPELKYLNITGSKPYYTPSRYVTSFHEYTGW